MTATVDVSLPFVYPEQPTPPPRPTSRSRNVQLAAVRSILGEVTSWFSDWADAPDRDGVINDLMLVVGEHDGYVACRRLERERGWCPDENLVDILAGLAGAVATTEEAAVKAWAEANGVRPHLSIGDVVGTPHGTGPIISVREGGAAYVVQTDEYLRRHPGGLGGFIVAYEKCTPAARAAA